MTAREAAAMIDISAVRTASTRKDIEECVAYAKAYHFINVHSLPCWTKDVAEMLRDVPDVYVGAPVGFPAGGNTTSTKIAEAMTLVKDGVEEMDIVMNVGKFKSGDTRYALDDIRQVMAVTPDTILKKVIIELNCLDDAEMERACELVVESGADFLKTGTGWVPGNANVDRIAKILKILDGRVKVKAAGGIRTRDEFMRLRDLGVARFGINTASAIRIVRSFE